MSTTKILSTTVILTHPIVYVRSKNIVDSFIKYEYILVLLEPAEAAYPHMFETSFSRKSLSAKDLIRK